MARVLLISLYDAVSLSNRMLSAALKRAGHEPYLVFFKEHVARETQGFIGDPERAEEFTDYYADSHQYMFNGRWFGCSELVSPWTEDEMKALVNMAVVSRPAVVGVSCRSMNLRLARTVVARLRAGGIGCPIVTGGYGPSMEPGRFLEVFDFTCVGEGEDFMVGMASGASHHDVPNLAWREWSTSPVLFNGLAQPADLDGLWPDWDFDNKWLIEGGGVHLMKDSYDSKVYDLFASRGCPSTCTYCQAHQWGRVYAERGARCPKVRARSVKSVISELKRAKERFGLVYVRFLDSVFGLGKGWVDEFCEAYTREVALPFFANLDARWSTPSIIRALRGAGLVKTVIGIQSTSERVRREVMGRGTLYDDALVEFAMTLWSEDVAYQYDLIHWNPFDTEESLREGLAFLKRMPKSNQVIVCQLKFFPGADIYGLYRERRPKYLPKEVFDQYAYLYSLILRGEIFKGAALAYPPDALPPSAELARMYEALRAVYGNECLVVKFPIRAGELVTTLKFEIGKGKDRALGYPHSIPYDDRFQIAKRAAKRDMAPGYVPTWEDFE